MKNKLGVVFAAFEAVPFMKTGGLGDVGGSLPKALQKAGCDVRVMLPKFMGIPEEYKKKMTRIAEFQVMLGWRTLYCGVEKLEYNGVTYCFIDNEYYFRREKPYGYFDDGERIAFFAKAVVESLQHLQTFKCDILHCNDWHASLCPVFLREFYRGIPLYDDIRTVFTVHNLKYQGKMSDYVLGDILGLSGIPAASDQLHCGEGTIDFMKGALCYSDMITTVSPSYAEEIKTPFYGEGLDDIFRRRSDSLRGILNGIDNDDYNPKTDSRIVANYDKSNMKGKAQCKAALQKEMGLDVNPKIPLMVMIGRLTEQKGLDLLHRVGGEMLEKSMQLVILGTGDQKYEDMMNHFKWRYQGKMNAVMCFDEALSRRMYSGADILLMPSLFEPCGLSQMIAMRYGTLPVVRETGGLRDSVIPYNQYTGEGTGFSFANYNAHEMMHAALGAVDLYHSAPSKWKAIVQNAMNEDFGWNGAAQKYMDMYLELKPEYRTKNKKGEVNEDIS